MLHRRGRRHRTAAALLTTALLLTGCSDATDDPAKGVASSSTPSPSASTAGATPSRSADPGTVVPAAPEPPAARKGPRGQKAFAAFVMRTWSWSLRSNDSRALSRLSPGRKQLCEGCRALAKELARRDRQGWYVDFPGLDVGRTRLRPEGDVVVATSRVDIPGSDSFYEDGGFRSSSPAHDDARFTVTMRWSKRGYRLLSFSVR